MIPNIPPWVVALAIMGVALLVILLLRALFAGGESAVQRRLRSKSPEDSGVLAWGKTSRPDSESEFILRRPAPPGPGTGMRWIDSQFERMITRSGLQVTAGQALAVTALLGAAFFAALYLWREEVWLATLGLALGMGIPLSIFWYMQSRYQVRMQNQLPDAFFLLARSLRAGLNLEQGLDLVGEQGVQPLAAEFQRSNGQVRLGLTIPAALQLMAERVQLLDFNAFVSTLTYYQSTGGNLPLLLDRLAASSRDRNQFRGQFLALTAQGRITAIFLGLFPFVLLLGYVLFEPEHVRTFFSSRAGWLLLLGAFMLQIVGVFWLLRLLRIRY